MGALSALHCISEHIGEKDDRFRQLSEERLNFRRFTTSKASEVLGPPSLHSSQPKHKLVHSERITADGMDRTRCGVRPP